MPAPLSMDLRKRIVEAQKDGFTYRQIAKRLQVGEASVSRILHRYRNEGSYEPIVEGKGRPSKIRGKVEKILRGIVEKRSDATIADLQEALVKKTGNPVSTSAISRALARMGLTRKKKPFVPKNNYGRKQ